MHSKYPNRPTASGRLFRRMMVDGRQTHLTSARPAASKSYDRGPIPPYSLWRRGMEISRRGFFKATTTGMGLSTLAAMGFSSKEALAQIREFKLAKTSETRNTCPYCSVGCGLIMHGLGDESKNASTVITHIEGDPDHPVNRGTLCPKGASLIDFIHSPHRLRFPEYRGPGETEWKRVTWDWALDRITQLMKEDRDANFVEKSGDITVNRWTTTAFLAASASSNETGYITVKMLRALGMTALDNQARV